MPDVVSGKWLGILRTKKPPWSRCPERLNSNEGVFRVVQSLVEDVVCALFFLFEEFVGCRQFFDVFD